MKLAVNKSWFRGLVTGFPYFVWNSKLGEFWDGRLINDINCIYSFEAHKLYYLEDGTCRELLRDDIEEWLSSSLAPGTWKAETLKTFNRPSLLRPIMRNGLYFKRLSDVLMFKMVFAGAS